MRFVPKARLAAAIVLALSTSLLIAAPANAASVSVTDLTTSNGAIGAEVRRAVLGINMTGGGTLNGVSVTLADVGGDGDFDLTTLSDLQGNPNGVAVYRDSSRTGANEDALDDGDTLVSSFINNGGGDVDVSVSSSVPAGAEGSYTFFLAVETSNLISNGDDFTVAITGGLCPFATSPVTLFCSGGTTGTIVADTVAPSAFLTGLPATENDNVVWTFNEDVTGVATDNVVLRVDGTTTNLDAVVTYDANARTATIDPASPLTQGETYDSLVNPGSAVARVTDKAGNPVPQAEGSFTVADLGMTPGIVRGNVWYLNKGFDAIHEISFAFGRSTDVPMVGDWDGDGDWTAGLVRGNVWYFANENDGLADVSFAFGRPTDTPIVGDWDGDGDFTAGVIRGNIWFLANENDGQADAAFAFGKATDFPVVGDWNDDGTWTAGVVRGNVWYLNNQNDSLHDVTFAFGKATDYPVVGDWDDDGKVTPGLVRGNLWYLNDGFDATHDIAFAFGKPDDFPVAGDWVGPMTASASKLPKLPKLTAPASS